MGPPLYATRLAICTTPFLALFVLGLLVCGTGQPRTTCITQAHWDSSEAVDVACSVRKLLAYLAPLSAQLSSCIYECMAYALPLASPARLCIGLPLLLNFAALVSLCARPLLH